MRFEEREIKDHGEPVKANELRQGHVYFWVVFDDEEMLIPNLQPVVYVGRNLESGDSGVVYFQDVDSYQRGIRYESTEKDQGSDFFRGSENETSHIFVFERALDVLLGCSLRRREAGLD